MVIDRSPNIVCRYTKLYANTLRRRFTDSSSCRYGATRVYQSAYAFPTLHRDVTEESGRRCLRFQRCFTASKHASLATERKMEHEERFRVYIL